MNAFQQGLDVEPTQPQGFPAWWPIPFAPQVATLAGNGMPTLLGGQLGSRHVGQVGHDLHQIGWQHLLDWLLRRLAGQCTQVQQPHRLRRAFQPERHDLRPPLAAVRHQASGQRWRAQRCRDRQ